MAKSLLALLALLAVATAPAMRVHVLGIAGHHGYETITTPIAGAFVTSDGQPQTVRTDASGWANVSSNSCQIKAAAEGFEPADQQTAPADSGASCPNTAEITLMKTSLLTDAALRRIVDVTVLDAATVRPVPGASVACVLYYDGSGKPRLIYSQRTDARGRTRITAFVRLDLNSNQWWKSLDRIDLAVAKPGYVSEIDTLTPIGPEKKLPAEIRLGRT